MDGFLRRYLRDLSWVAAGMGGALVVDFAFYILVGRLLSPVEFGYFGVMTSLYYILLRSPFRGIEMVSKRMQAEGTDSALVLGRPALIAGLTMFFLFLVLGDGIAGLVGVPADLVRVFALVFPAGYYLAVVVGQVQGEERYALYGMHEFLGSLAAFSAILLVYHGAGAAGAVAMFVIEIVAGLAVISRGKPLRAGARAFTRHRLLRDSFAFVIAVHLSFSLDLLAVNHVFPGETVGHYNTVAVLGKGLFFGTVAVNRSVFPKFVTIPDDRLRNLVFSFALVVAAGAAAAAFFLVSGAPFIAATFGAEYVVAAMYAPHYMVMITGIAVAALLANYHLAAGTGRVLLIAVLPATQIALIALFHGTVIQIIYATFTASALAAAVLAVGIIRRT